MSEEIKNIEAMEEESSIDFGKIFQDIKKHKKLYYKVLPIAFVLAAIYALSLPNYYQCTVKLSPELSSSRSSSGLASLASNFGLNLGMGGGGIGTEALFPTIYPELVNSTDFKTSLFPVHVTIEGNKKNGEADRTMTYYDYLENEQKSPWWSTVIAAPFKLLGKLLSSSDTTKVNRIDRFRLTKKQADIVKALNKKVVCDVDKKTMVITIDVTDQNPVICATMADSVKTAFRTLSRLIEHLRFVLILNTIRRFVLRPRNVMRRLVRNMLNSLMPTMTLSCRRFARSRQIWRTKCSCGIMPIRRSQPSCWLQRPKFRRKLLPLRRCRALLCLF